MKEGLGARVIFRVVGGPLDGLVITETAIWTVIVAIGIIIFALLATRKLERYPKGLQAVAELIVEYVYKFVRDTMGKRNLSFAPYVGTLFLFLLFGNALGLLGFRPITADMNTTFAMSALVFILIQVNGIRSRGFGHYLKHFAEPYPFMIPIKILEEFTFPISLAFRIFGNILAGVIIMELAMEGLKSLSLETLHLPIPLLQTVLPLPLNLFFDIFEPILQAFVFTMLTMSFIAKAIVSHSGAEDDDEPGHEPERALGEGFNEDDLFVSGADYSDVKGYGDNRAESA
ncbi:MAG: F0F1 ATP synthase subunit A [Clostridiales Family XIII bacterium]|jgi:F-type H+-transporting ATPase subunit a|nr:F0F1 ATP synthase subunit A [Clostridiales Family XIII bacterium]